jgi:hypothetical protein
MPAGAEKSNHPGWNAGWLQRQGKMPFSKD